MSWACNLRRVDPNISDDQGKYIGNDYRLEIAYNLLSGPVTVNIRKVKDEFVGAGAERTQVTTLTTVASADFVKGSTRNAFKFMECALDSKASYFTLVIDSAGGTAQGSSIFRMYLLNSTKYAQVLAEWDSLVTENRVDQMIKQ